MLALKGRRLTAVLAAAACAGGSALAQTNGVAAPLPAPAPQAPPPALLVCSGAVVRAAAAVSDGFHDLAEQELRAALADTAGVPVELQRRALYLLIRSLHGQKKWAGMASALDPNGRWREVMADAAPEFVYWRALAAYEQDQADAALRELAAAEAKFAPGTETAGRALRLRAWCLLKSGVRDEALRLFESFDRDYRSSPDVALNLLDWGRTLASAGRWEDARGVLERLAGFPPDRAMAQEGQFVLGQVLIRLGDGPGAERVLVALAGNAKAPSDLRADAWFSAAGVREAAGRPDAAVEGIRQALDLTRDAERRRKGSLQLGRLLLRLGTVDEGMALVKGYIVQAPHEPVAESAQLEMAGALLAAGQNDKAVAEYQNYLETYTNLAGTVAAQAGRAMALLRLGRYAESAAAFTRAAGLTQDPAERERCLFKAGDAYFDNKQYELAAGSYSNLVHQFPTSSLAAQAMLQTGEARMRAGQAPAAEAAFARLHARYPRSPFAEEGLVRLAGLQRGQRRWTDAVRTLETVMTTYTNGAHFAAALQGRGMIRYRLLQFDQALADFEDVIRRFEASAVAEQAFYMRGLCYYLTWQDEKALKAWDLFFERFPDSPWAADALFWRGKHRYNQEAFAQAQEDFIRLAEKHPADPLADDALLWAGRAALRRKEFSQAMEILAGLVQRYPDSDKMAEARFAQADALWEQAKYDAAILVCDEIVNKHPNSDLVPAVWGRKGDCQFTLGAENPKRFAESLASYRIVAEHPGSSPDLVLQAEYKIGRSLEKMGQPDEAFRHYYMKVVVRYTEDRDRGAWMNDAAKLWFTRAALNAAAIAEAREDWARVLRVLERVIRAGVPAAAEASERIRKIQADHWWDLR